MSDRIEIRVSTTLMKIMFPEGEEKPICPRQLKFTNIDKLYKMKRTVPMAAGSYFEYCCLGAGAGDDTVTDFTTIKAGKGGAKSVDQIRMEDQAIMFDNLREKLGASKATSVQQRVAREWEHDNNIWSDMYEILITGVLDWTGPVEAMGFDSNGNRELLKFKDAVHDLKLTADIWGTFGKNKTWAYPWTMDNTQLAVYNWITGLPTLYWVFDYKPKPEFRIYHHEITAIEQAEMHETIRKTAEKLVMLHETGFPAAPAHFRCKDCPLSAEHCNERVDTPDIQIF